ncbi:MAG: DUF2589 domain-containing protein [Gammaproteobacteria bacterium]|nr:DUF2589 domain-containing protein [Gammaproteobacteria bacterium]MXW10058.1 DUF2589 domain-containing protein [Gammaproteobacteria bacterium]MYC52395.1 DUF2589 domain-containing protein [Gammaproteobacteria bacterium]
MAGRLIGNRSFSLYQLIGAPLMAMVQGQAQAAQATAEFIDRIGFLPSEDDAARRLRMIAFHYTRPGPDGEPRRWRLDVPLLSLVPIPAIQIREADIEFAVRVSDVGSTASRMSLSEESRGERDWLGPGRAELRGTVAKLKPGRAGDHNNVQMHVKMKVEQAALSEGIVEIGRVFKRATDEREDAE